MLSRSQRLSVEQFNSVMEKGRVVHSSLFLMRVLKDEFFTVARISAVAPTKIAKTAILRNKTRRVIYSAVRPIYKSLPKNIHAIIIAKDGALKADFQAKSNDIREIFVKAGLLK